MSQKITSNVPSASPELSAFLSITREAFLAWWNGPEKFSDDPHEAGLIAGDQSGWSPSSSSPPHDGYWLATVASGAHRSVALVMHSRGFWADDLEDGDVVAFRSVPGLDADPRAPSLPDVSPSGDPLSEFRRGWIASVSPVWQDFPDEIPEPPEDGERSAHLVLLGPDFPPILAHWEVESRGGRFRDEYGMNITSQVVSHRRAPSPWLGSRISSEHAQ